MLASWDFIKTHAPSVALDIAREYADNADVEVNEYLGLPPDAKIGVDEAMEYIDSLNDEGGLAFDIDEAEASQEGEAPDLQHVDGITPEAPSGVAEVADVNNDGDADVAMADTNGNGEPDMAVVDADSKEEEKQAVDEAKDKLSDDDLTSTGKTEEELSDSKPTDVSDKKEKNVKKDASCDGDCPSAKKKKDEDRPSRSELEKVSDVRQKNIVSALMDLRF